MIHRAFLSAFAAILLSATLVQTAAAYPSTARRAITTVTGAYRPLSLDLTLVDGTDALYYSNVPDSTLYFEVLFNGTFTGIGYEASGFAGNWRLVLSDTFNEGIGSYNDGGIFMFSAGPGLQVGTLTYEGGLIVETGELPLTDTPIVGDEFRLFTTAEGTVLTVDCDTITTCSDFDLTLLQDLEHLGPYVPFVRVAVLDGSRLNEDCGSVYDPEPCGSFTGLIASSVPSAVPEPATLVLMLSGLGLVGLRLSRRARA